MVKSVKLYNDKLFSRACTGTVILYNNNPPNGLDLVSNKDVHRRGDNGICNGITIAWVIGFIHGRKESATGDKNVFKSYFQDVLRFQGAYLSDYSIRRISSINELRRNGIESTEIAAYEHIPPQTLKNRLPSSDINLWAGFLAIYGHAIGVGFKSSSFYILEPNAGLFVYKSKNSFILDLEHLIIARECKKSPASNSVSAYFFNANKVILNAKIPKEGSINPILNRVTEPGKRFRGL